MFDLTANKSIYALIAESLSTLQAADTSQNNFCNAVCCFGFPSDDTVRVKQSIEGV